VCAVANNYNDSTRNIDSKIYKWDGTVFAEIQSIPTNGAYDWESFQINGETYLAVANHRNDSTRNIDSKIYKSNLNVDITLNHSFFSTGATLIAEAHTINDGTPDTVEVMTWVETPNGNLISISRQDLNIPAYANITVTILSYTFDGTENAGEYKISTRFLSIINGDHISEGTETFNFAP